MADLQLRGETPWYDQPASSQSLWVRMSLVCKDWGHIAEKHRRLLVFDSLEAIEKFVMSPPTSLPMGLHVAYHDCFPDDLLAKVLPTIRPTVSAISLNANNLAGRHANVLFKNQNSQIEHVIIHDRSWIPESTAPWWKSAYHLHRVPKLAKLSLARITIFGTFKAFQASVVSPIEELLLLDVIFTGQAAVEHFAWPLVHTLRHLHVKYAQRETYEPGLLWLLKILGPRLETLVVEGSIITFGKVVPLVPNIRTLSLSTGDFISRSDDLDANASLSSIPSTLEYIHLASDTLTLAIGFVSRVVQDPIFCPALKAIPILRRRSASLVTIRKMITDENLAGLRVALAILRDRGLRLAADEFDETIWALAAEL